MLNDDLPLKEEIILPSTIEDIDAAMLEYIKDELDIFTETNRGWGKVPVIWVAAERAAQIKQIKELRDTEGSMIYPLITLERSSIAKDLSKKGSVFANIPPVNDAKRGSITVARRLNQKKTSEFANADAKRRFGQVNFKTKKQNKKIVYETYTVPLPVYITVNYVVSITTEYQQQMNDIMTPFITKPGGINYFQLKRNGHMYEGFIDADFTANNTTNDLGEQERKFVTDINIRVLGYLIGEDKNQESPKIVKRQNAVEVRFPRERVIFGDIPEDIDEKGFYRP
mgnify:CR=1 FL=1|tara:strand:- start:667 stop:1515 length:849 start_codon:yes stop_codon:yes gene_type:complete